MMQTYPEIWHHFTVGCLPVAGLAVPAFIVWIVPGPRPDHGPGRPAPEMAWFKLELLYREAAGLVILLLEPGNVVAAADIGAVCWFTVAPILDTMGLISPEAVSYYPLDPSQMVINYAISPDLIRDYQS